LKVIKLDEMFSLHGNITSQHTDKHTDTDTDRDTGLTQDK